MHAERARRHRHRRHHPYAPARPQDGITCVSEPSPTRHTSAAAVAMANAAADYLRTDAKLPPYDKRVHSGFWRLVVGE